MQGLPLLSLITFLPILGMILILFIPGKRENLIKWTTAVVTFLQLVIAIVLWQGFNFSAGGINDPSSFQFVEKWRWIEIKGLTDWLGTIKIDYYLGLDGLSLPMVVLTSLICFIATLASWNIGRAVKGYFALYLLLDTGMMGSFLALDFFLFYVFWELMLLPMYFLIGIWGGPRKEYAAIKFFIYTLFGSVFMLLVMIGLYFSVYELMPDGSKVFSFNMLTMMNPSNYGPEGILSPLNPENLRLVAYIFLFMGFAIKVPMFPFHTWLPDAHVEAPTPISVILAGILLKLGTYGMLRISFPMFPEITMQLSYWIAVFGMINIIYGALCAMAQKDFKKLIAYSSISHMGYVLLGMASLTSQGMVGAVFQMFNHGIITAMLFLIVGVLYDRSHTRGVDEFGGLANQMPVYTAIVAIAFFASLGLPGLSGFISEAFVFLGAFSVDSIRIITIISTSGIILTAAYMLWTLQRIFFGKLNEKWSTLTEINKLELFTLVPLAVIVIVFGVWPSPMLDMMNTSLNKLVELVANAQVVYSNFGM